MEKTCKELVNEKWEDTKKELSDFFNRGDYQGLSDYGLDISLVESDTFEGKEKPYIRYQFSWGGPADELRIFKDGTIEYWYLDWFDGASVDVSQDKTAQETADYCMELVHF